MLKTPAHLGNGDTDSPLDMAIIRDSVDGCALLTGTSIAGALRNYVREYENENAANLLFGQLNEESKSSHESWLIVEDAFGNIPLLEIRDNVSINTKTRLAEDKRKFDIELLTEGTIFTIRFELLLPQGSQQEAIKLSFAKALYGLEKGYIHLGKRKRRGFGKCNVTSWTVTEYDVSTRQGLIDWLENNSAPTPEKSSIATLLGLTEEQVAQCSQDCFEMEAVFNVKSSILIGSGSGETNAPDKVHLRSKRGRKDVPILSGTSLAGALRSRAIKIGNTLGKDGYTLANDLFGNHYSNEDLEKLKETDEDRPILTASRIWIEETEIKDPLEFVHTRVKIDRFTGGAFPGALFSEQPVYGNDKTEVTIRAKIERAQKADIGLVLLLLKDLWTGDLPVGGGNNVGRGKLQGKKARFSYNGAEWEISQGDNALDISSNEEGKAIKLQDFVDAFTKKEENHD